MNKQPHNKNNIIKIILVEDHQLVRKSLRTLLELDQRIEVIAEASNGSEAVDLAKIHRPDIFIMDIAMSKLNGIEATKLILKINPKSNILFLTAHTDDGYILHARNLKVSGYLLKQCSPDLLFEAINEIIKGNFFYAPTIAEKFKSLLIIGLQILSSRERQVLQLIAEGYSNKQIAYDLKISFKTVEKHRQNLMDKLEIHDTAGLTRYAISHLIISCDINK